MFFWTRTQSPSFFLLLVDSGVCPTTSSFLPMSQLYISKNQSKDRIIFPQLNPFRCSRISDLHYSFKVNMTSFSSTYLLPIRFQYGIWYKLINTFCPIQKYAVAEKLGSSKWVIFGTLKLYLFPLPLICQYIASLSIIYILFWFVAYLFITLHVSSGRRQFNVPPQF